ncbi:MAG: DUF6062 family protein [Oscillospiraceae bacterium]|jgi:hypothetical protein|nr:DUF6062 family protein [Oscillospiraceae bacterium]
METIYTIPLNEAFDRQDGDCPFCTLEQKLEANTLEYVLGPAMMEPDVRQTLNKSGFCAEHWTKLYAQKNKLALSLILETRSLSLLQDIELLNDKDCFICKRVRTERSRYMSNATHMWEKVPDFRKKLEGNRSMCTNHSAELLRTAKAKLRKKDYAVFKAAIASGFEERLKTQAANARAFADSFDYRSNGEKVDGGFMENAGGLI